MNNSINITKSRLSNKIKKRIKFYFLRMFGWFTWYRFGFMVIFTIIFEVVYKLLGVL